jgi:capsular polysaccharide export protein
MEATITARIGGTYWGAQPRLPDAPYTLIRVANGATQRKLLATLDADRTVLASGNFDPWHMVSGAEQLIVDADDEFALIGGLAGVSVRCVG